MSLPASASGLRRGPGRFADPAVVKQGWYLLGRSRRLRAGRARAVAVGPRRVVAYRGLDGRAHAADARCPHLGADLSLGSVASEGLRCAFHGWCWDAEGACAAAPAHEAPPSRRLRVYATTERWGFLWAWLGGAPAFPLPELPAHLARRWVLPPQRLRGHPDVVFANGFDLAHFGPSHGIEAATVSLDAQPPWRIAHRVEGRLPRRPRLAWAGLAGGALDATFTQHGGGIVHVHVRRPVEYGILFTLRPDAEGGARAQTLLFLRRRRDMPRALALLWGIALDDIPLMEGLAWTGAFAPGDDALERYARFVEAMPAW